MKPINLLEKIIQDGHLSEENAQLGKILLEMAETNDKLAQDKSFIARVTDLEREVISWRNSFPYLSFDFSSGKFVSSERIPDGYPDAQDVLVAFQNADVLARSQIMTAIQVAVKHSAERATVPDAVVVSIRSARQPKV